MIPTEGEAKALWIKYSLPDKKQLHVSLVARVAKYLSLLCEQKIPGCHIQKQLVYVSALLHDIDKAVLPKIGERHPDTAVRILREEGMDEVADVVKTHPLHAILDPAISPTTWEERLLYLSDKMVKFSIITVDQRFHLWRAEHLPREAEDMLDATYPKVKKLEREICEAIGVAPSDIAKLA